MNIIEISYRFDDKKYEGLILYSVSFHTISELEGMTDRMKLAQLQTINLTDKEVIKDHMQLKSLRTLILRGNSIIEVPKEIGGLIHLRYLELSQNEPLKELPDSVCDLYNLQTLRLENCSELVKFPDEEAMRKLTKLKHLYVKGCTRLKSKGIRRLGALQKLDVFHINGFKGGDSEGTSKLEDLKDLHQLEGSLDISHLESVEDAREAAKACLSEKHLLRLLLDFECFQCDGPARSGQSGEGSRAQIEREILNGLQPHEDLRELFIVNVACLCQDWILSLHKLTSLALGYFNKCELLTGPFGKLPSLESLKFCSMPKVKKVGVEFLGVDDGELQSSSSSACLTLFPRLKSLKFGYMEWWDEWEGLGGDFQNDNIKIMPSLSHLQFYDCPKLRTLPDFLRNTPLQRINHWDSPVLRAIVEEKTSEEWAKISHVPDIEETY